MRAAAIVALLVGWASIARAETTLIEQLADHLAEGRFAEAYALAGELVAVDGEDPDVRYYASVACLRTARFAEAEQHVDAGLAKYAANSDLLGLRAQILLFHGDEAGASAAVTQALAISADAPDAIAARDELELGAQARARRAGEDPGLPAGSPAAFVDAMIAGVAAGDPPAEIARAFDLEILSSVPPRDRTQPSLVAGIGTALREARAMRDKADQQFYGWVTAPDATPSGDRAIVDVIVPIETTFTARQRAAIGAAVSDPALRGTVDPGILAMVDGVPEADRDALLDRMVGVRTRSMLDLHFEVAGGTGDYRITDLAFGGVSLKDQLGNFSKVIDKVDPPRARFQLTPEVIGAFAGLVAGIIVIVVMATRRRRR